METIILSTKKEDINKAGEILKNGGLVAFPTETVYGLGANALDENAVKNIFIAKGRPSDNPLIIHIAEKEDIIPLVKEVTPKAKALIDAFFPAALTIILKKSEIIPSVVSGGLDTVAVRMPKSETARAVIKASSCPIAAPSANTSGLPSPTKAQHVISDMLGKIDAIIDGEDCEVGVESTVISLVGETPVILRPGAVTKEMIENVIGRVELSPAVLNEIGENEKAASPGMKYKHYAPKAKVVVVDGTKEQYENFVNSKPDAFALCFDEDNVTVPHLTFGSEKDGLSQAKRLFDDLRKLDDMGVKKVYARMPEKTGVGIAVYNRLIRAAAWNVIDLKKPFIIGLTGPTGAGKGYVCDMLKERGFNIIDSDKVYREMIENDGALLSALEKEFGKTIIENNKLNRKALAKIAFKNKENTARLNKIVHPAIIEKCKNISKPLSVLDAPQLFEAGGEKDCYKVISVIAPKEVRLKRIITRDSITEEEAIRRMSVQFNDDYYISHSDYVINNDNSDLTKQINNILEEIL